MTWYSRGPDMVVNPKHENYRRISRRNEVGSQCTVVSIAVGPASESVITVVTRRVGGSAAFRTVDDGASWTCITDALARAIQGLSITCVVNHPTDASVLWLGTQTGVFVSTDGGGTWPTHGVVGAPVRSLVVDAAPGTAWANVVLYAATDIGIGLSTDGGQNWTHTSLGGTVDSLAVYRPPGTAADRRFYAGVRGRGLLYSAQANSGWTPLFGLESGLPSVVADPRSEFAVFVDFSPDHPERVYALVSEIQINGGGVSPVSLYAVISETGSGATLRRTWTDRALAGPGPLLFEWTLEGTQLVVFPRGATAGSDVLLCTGGVLPWRSRDGGATAEVLGGDASMSHTDWRALAYFPPGSAYYPGAGGIPAPFPRVYCGNDGGVARSTRLADPAYDVRANFPAVHNNEAGTVDSMNGVPESLDHGLGAVAGFQYASSPDPLAGGPPSAIGYIATLDTGTSRHIGTRASRNVGDGDAGVTIAIPTLDGIRVTQNASTGIGWALWPAWNLVSYLDRDGPASDGAIARVMTTAGQPTGATSNMVFDPPDAFHVGIVTREQVSLLAGNVPAHMPGSTITITTQTATDIAPSDFVFFGSNPDTADSRVVYDVLTPNQFTIRSSRAYAANTPVFVKRHSIARVAGTSASRVSTVLGGVPKRVYRMARTGDVGVAATMEQQVIVTTSLPAATPSTVWSVAIGRPAALDGVVLEEVGDGENVSGVQTKGAAPIIAALVREHSGAVYALLTDAVAPAGGGAATALYRVDSGAWTAEACSPPLEAFITAGVVAGAVVAHPERDGVLYASRADRVFEITKDSSDVWQWTSIAENLPGQEVHDLWIGNVAAAGAPRRIVLRALTAARGLWERDIDGPPRGEHLVHFRDTVFDPGWLGASADHVANPLRAGENVHHWQSPDIKVDAPERDATGMLFYQNEPDAPTVKAADFAWLRDKSDGVPAGQALRVWVQVHNRSATPARELKVWAIACLYAAGLPALPRTAELRDFWTRFASDGSLDTTLEPVSPWIALVPRTPMLMPYYPVTGVFAEAPGVASFEVPAGASGDRRCVVAFVHGSDARLDVSGLTTSVDDVVPRQPQVAQRNISVGAPLAASPGARQPSLPGELSVTGPGGAAARVRRYIEFNNPRAHATTTTVRIDSASLPAALSVSFRLSENARPVSIVGATKRELAASPFDVVLAVLEAFGAFVQALLRIAPAKRWAPPKLRLADVWHDATPGVAPEVRDVPISAHGRIAAEISFRVTGALEPGSEHRVDVLQLEKERIVGGATIIVPIAGVAEDQPTWGVNGGEREVAGGVDHRGA